MFSFFTEISPSASLGEGIFGTAAFLIPCFVKGFIIK